MSSVILTKIKIDTRTTGWTKGRGDRAAKDQTSGNDTIDRLNILGEILLPTGPFGPIEQPVNDVANHIAKELVRETKIEQSIDNFEDRAERDATSEERQDIRDAYNEGYDNGYAGNDYTSGPAGGDGSGGDPTSGDIPDNYGGENPDGPSMPESSPDFPFPEFPAGFPFTFPFPFPLPLPFPFGFPGGGLPGLGFAFGNPLYSPLVVDVGDDGITLHPIEDHGVFFDTNGDDFAELTGWVLPGDALLALDRNNNGRIVKG